MVAAEGQHGKRITTDLADLVRDGGSGDFRAHDRAEEDAMVPVKALMNQRDGGFAAATDEDRGDRHASRIFPFRSDNRTLLGRGGETGIRMGSRFAGSLGPVAALPVDQVLRSIAADAFPPHIAIVSQADIGEDGVLVDAAHRVEVGVIGGTRGNTEEAGFRIDRIEAAVSAVFHPGDIVTDGFDFPAGDGRDQHGQVGLAAGARESTGDVFDVAFGAGQAQDQHVFGEPAFIAGLDGSDAQGEALFAEEGVAAVTGAVGPDQAFIREMADVFLIDRGTGPGDVLLAFSQRSAD